MKVPEISKYKKPILIGFGILVVIALLAFGGNEYRKYNETLLNDALNALEDEKQASLKRQDSFISIITDSDYRLSDLEYLLSEKERQNNYLQYKLNEREKNLYILDPVFISNASRTAEYNNRYYKKDSITR
jgi:hypothetical protein